MATSQSTIDYILDQVTTTQTTARKMFGEYALYCHGKVVALVCDNSLFVKITEPGKQFVGNAYHEGFPYPGAKPAMQISPENVEDADWLSELITLTAAALPTPKPKKPRA